MRQAFAHSAEVTLSPGGDVGAPGAAITVALCGHWEHEPPCPLAPHHTSTERVGDVLHVRTLFAVDHRRVGEVCKLIETALASGRLVGPDGNTTAWRLCSSRLAEVLETELDHVGRLIQG